MPRASLVITGLLILLALIPEQAIITGLVSPTTISSTGLVGNVYLKLWATPSPSRFNQSIRIFGNLTATAGISVSQQDIVIQCSGDSSKWTNISSTTTNGTGGFSLNLVPPLKGDIYLRALACGRQTSLRHLVADCIVAADNSGDFVDVSEAVNAMPNNGSTIYVKDGKYSLARLINLTAKSNFALIGNGYNTILEKSSGVALRIAEAVNLTLKQLHFHYLTNDAYTAIRVEGENSNIVITDNWFTRDAGSSNIENDLIYLDETSLTENLVIRNCRFEKAQVDAIALKRVVNGVVENNTVIDASTDYVKAAGITIDRCLNVTIRKNYFIRTGNQEMIGVSVFGNSSSVNIIDNDILNMGKLGLSIFQGVDISVENNRIVNACSIGVRAENTSRLSISYNCFEANGSSNTTGIFVTNCDDVTVEANNVSRTENCLVVLCSSALRVSGNNMDSQIMAFASDEPAVLIHGCTSAKITNNSVAASCYFGIAVALSPKATVEKNIVFQSMLSGIWLWCSNDSAIRQNVAKNNGQYQSTTIDRYGITVADSSNCTINDNKAFDDQPSKTQLYGLIEKGTSDYNVINGNDFRNNKLGALKTSGDHTTVTNNLG